MKRCIQFWSFPSLLIIDLKRFSNSNRKNQGFIDFPLENLDLSKYIVGYQRGQYKYDLYGICNHSGSVFGGHYTAFIKNANSVWYHFNDTKITGISDLNQLKSPKAYCFFYRKKKITAIIYTMDMNISPSMLFSQTYDMANEKVIGSNMIVVVVLSVIIVMFYILSKSLAGHSAPKIPPLGGGQGAGLNLLEVIMWGSVIFLIMINGFQYLFGIDIKASIKKIFSGIPEIDVSIRPHNDGRKHGKGGHHGHHNKDDDRKKKEKERKEKERKEKERKEKERKERKERKKREEEKHKEEKKRREEERKQREKRENRRRKEKAKRERDAWVRAKKQEEALEKRKRANEEARKERLREAERLRQEAEKKSQKKQMKVVEEAKDDKDNMTIRKPNEIQIEKQVFHIPVNKYTYNDAKAVCGAFGGSFSKL